MFINFHIDVSVKDGVKRIGLGSVLKLRPTLGYPIMRRATSSIGSSEISLLNLHLPFNYMNDVHLVQGW